MPSNDKYHQQHHAGKVASRRRLPFDSTSGRMALKPPVSNTFRYPQSNHRHESFINKSSSSSITAEDEYDGAVKMLDETIPENGFSQADNRKNTITNSRHLSMNNHNNKRDIGGPVIQELLQSNMNLKKEIRDIRRQIKHNNGSNKQRIDRVMTTTSTSNKSKILDDDDNDCSYPPPEHDYYNDSSSTMSKLQHYKTEATLYKQQLDTCQETIAHLQKTIQSMEKRIEQLKTTEHRQTANASNQHENFISTGNNNTDHRIYQLGWLVRPEISRMRDPKEQKAFSKNFSSDTSYYLWTPEQSFIHELFHLCIKYTPRSSKLKTTVPSHQDMKTYIRHTFTDLIKASSSKISANRNHDIGHFICKCSDRSHTDHRPTYQYCLSLIEQCQSLFDVTCYTQLSTALNELYYRHGELANFKRSIASTLGVTESSRLVSCPKLIKTLQQTLDDARSNELITFKKMAKINDMNEAISKIRSYDDFVPYYHQFIEQMANLLEVSKGDEIMPAIKTLKLLAHSDSYRPSSNSQPSYLLTRASSLNIHKDFHEKNFPHSKSLRILPSTSNIEQSKDDNLNSSEKANDDSEQKHDEDSQ